MKWLNTKTETPSKGTFAAIYDDVPGFLTVDSYNAIFTATNKEKATIEIEDLPIMQIMWLQQEREKIKVGDKYTWSKMEKGIFDYVVKHIENDIETFIAVTDTAEKADFISKACNHFKTI